MPVLDPTDPRYNPNGVVDGTPGADSIDSAYGDDQGDQIDNPAQVFAPQGPLDDLVFAGDGNDTIHPGDGADSVFGGSGDDLVYGDAGNDSLWGEAGRDTLYGNDGDDKLIGGAQDDLLYGGAGDDRLYGDSAFYDLGGTSSTAPAEAGFGNDTLNLDGGNDTAWGQSGNDLFNVFDDFGNHNIIGGETGETTGDTLSLDAVTQSTILNLNGPESGTIAGGASTLRFEEIERVILGSGADTANINSSSTSFIDGGAGFDTLVIPDPAPGTPAPVVNVTSSVTNPDGTVTYGGTVTFGDGSVMTFERFERIPCFTPGTLIDTARGRVAVEDLVVGDRVLTRDNGFRELVWTGRRDLSAQDVAECPALAPIRIAAGALGANLPERDLVVSPRHRMLVSGARAELMFGTREVLVAAADLLGLPGVTQDAVGEVSYLHIMCDAHEVIRAEGAWTESFQPSAVVLDSLDDATRAELLALFPDLTQRTFAAARPVLASAEARSLFAA